MKYDKKIEQLIAAPASTWSDDDVATIALAIKNNPNDDNLKNAFLNLDPRSELYCNRSLYVSLASLYSWIVRQYNAIYTLDEYIEAVSYHIWKNSFADWRPGDSLLGYIKYASLPHSPIGRDIRRNYYFIDAFRMDDPSNDAIIATFANENSSSPESGIISDTSSIIEDIRKIVRLSDIETTLIFDLAGKKITPINTAELNESFGTNFTSSELISIRENAYCRIKYRKKELKNLLTKYGLI